MRRGAFTLIELLVIVAIIGIMAAVSVLGVAAGQKAMRVKGATRDVFAAIRHARSTALVTQQPAIITYSMETKDGEPVAKIEITSAELLNTQADRSNLQTVTGAPIPGVKHEIVHIEKEGGDDITDKGGGMSVEDILFAPASEEVVRGMRIKVVHGDELGEAVAKGVKPSRLSVFSNVDYLLGRFKEAKAAKENEAEGKSDSEKGGEEKDKPVDDDFQEPVSIVWETNGRVEPHQVWIYPDGAKPEDGLSIRVDAFGGAKVLSGDGREE